MESSRAKGLPNAAIVVAVLASLASAQDTQSHPLTPVPIQQVTIEDDFWSPKRKVWREVTIPDCFTKFENDRGGAIHNFDRVRDGDSEQEYAGASATFTNPVVARGADPWVIRWRGDYYFCQSFGGGVRIRKAERLEDIGKGPWAQVWSPPPGQPYSRELWAPELHYLRGKWYIYVAADDGRNEHHRMYVLEGTSQDPRDRFEFKGQLTLRPDRWAIDGTVLEMPNGRLYFIWSGWEGYENVAQNLYIAAMKDPLTIDGDRCCLSRPEYDWEKRGSSTELPTINEGPAVLWHGDKLFLIYSASGSWGDDYCLGQLSWTGGDVLSPSSWVKKPVPVFARTKDVFGPGHCSLTKSPDEREDWIVYHAARHPGSGWDRDVRIQPFTWASDGSPRFGEPIAHRVPLPVPSGELSAGIQSGESSINMSKPREIGELGQQNQLALWSAL